MKDGIEVTCDSCQNVVTGQIRHLGFSVAEAFYCSACEAVLLADARGNPMSSYAELRAKPFEYYCRHLLPFWKAVSDDLPPCPCGGSFAYMNPPRCPQCHQLLVGNCYEDKPILKERDLRAFISGRSYDLEESEPGKFILLSGERNRL